MASIPYYPDPYQGWSVIGNEAGNVTAYQVFTDTSCTWVCTGYYGNIRTYQRY